MGRRRFDHLVVELSVAAGRLVPRYRLWLKLNECGESPEDLSRAGAVSFCEGPLRDFLRAEGLDLPARRLLQLQRAIQGFDPNVPTPCERLAHLG